MIDLARAIIDDLRGDVTLGAKLGTFMGHPAVFGASPVPENTGKPFILTTSVSDTVIPVKDSVIREVHQDVAIWDTEDGGSANVEYIAEYLREKLRAPFTVPDWNVSVQSVDGPRIADSEDLYGRVLTVRTVLDR